MKECCAVKTETVKQIHSKYELVKEDLAFSAVLGPSFTRKKVLHDEPLPSVQGPGSTSALQKQRNPHKYHPRKLVSVQVLLAFYKRHT